MRPSLWRKRNSDDPQQEEILINPLLPEDSGTPVCETDRERPSHPTQPPGDTFIRQLWFYHHMPKTPSDIQS